MQINYFLITIYSFCFLLYYFSIQGDKKILSAKSSLLPITGLLCVAFFIRIPIALLSQGHLTDMATFKAWAAMAAEHGLNNVYYTDTFLDYPPGYLYILFLLEKTRLLFDFSRESNAFTLLIKLPSMIADIACGLLIYKLSEKRVGNVMGAFLAGLFVFSPAVIINSTVWGQVDSVYTLALFVAVWFLFEEKIVFSSVLYGIAILLKPQALLFGPVFLFYIIEKKSVKETLKALGTGIATILVLSVPFTRGLNFAWLFEKYMTTLQSYPYVTVNAYNFYAFFGENWVKISESSFFMLSYNVWTTVFIALTVLFCGFLYFKSKNRAKIFFLPFLIMFMVFMLASKMHERYLFPALIFLLVSYLFLKDKRLFFLFLGMNAVHFLNVAHVLFLNNQGVGAHDPTMMLISFGHIVLFFWALYIAYDIFVRDHTITDFGDSPKPSVKKNVKKAPMGFGGYQKSKSFKKMKKADYILLSAIVLMYTVTSFWSLGSGQTANRFWQPSINTDKVILELEEDWVDRIYYISGIGDSHLSGRRHQVGVDFTIESSSDLLTWEPVTTIKDGYVYEWKTVPCNISDRFIKITANLPHVVLNEIAFKAAGEDRLVGVKVLSSVIEQYPNDPAAIIDEQSKIPLYPTWYDSTYFDEIYHARTAYEHIKGYEAYESTHPPMGKNIIALGILLFGMNPFGWRVAGVVFGILMLPLLYVFLKKMFGKTFLAAGGTFLFAFDFMHYTQSRIATIDTYAVFFGIAMFYFMYQYFCTSFYNTKLSKTLVMLLLSGVFMGLGISSKWTVAYGAVGLAVMFFVSLAKRYGEYLHAKKQVVQKKSIDELDNKIYQSFGKNAGITVLLCVAFFVMIPAGIYILSYLPFFNVRGAGHTLSDLIPYQQNMLSYHYSLQDDHFFSSKWWQWPLLAKPIWYHITKSTDTIDGTIRTISAFGNPAIWWTAILTMLMTLSIGIKKRDKNALFILIGYVFAYLPWVFVPRVVFIYHYYTAVPFLVMSILYVIDYLVSQRAERKKFVYLYFGICFGLFALFFPVLSGIRVWEDYVRNMLQWFSTWYFC